MYSHEAAPLVTKSYGKITQAGVYFLDVSAQRALSLAVVLLFVPTR